MKINIFSKVEAVKTNTSSCEVVKQKPKRIIFVLCVIVAFFCSYYTTNIYFFQCFSKSNSDIKTFLAEHSLSIEKDKLIALSSSNKDDFALPLKLCFTNDNLELLSENSALLSFLASNHIKTNELNNLITKIKSNERTGLVIGSFFY